MHNGEGEGKTLLDAMRDGGLDGMQDFDTVIKGMIERKVVTLEDGLAYSTNPHNLQLALKGVTIKDDYLGGGPAAPPPSEPQRGGSMMIDLT
ncbi:MAG: hypothetical protein LC800_04115 [Acidobacteria bacterium]|nr:hypothetical protein [Acidobacteriota bacterium]